MKARTQTLASLSIVFLLFQSLAAAVGAQERGITLEEVLALAAERNPRLHAASSLAEAAAAREPSAGLLPDPTLQLGVMNLALPEFSATMPASMAPAIQAMQMIPFPGKLSLRGDIAGQSTAMAQATVDEVRWNVRAEAATAFYRLYAVDHQIDVMRETLGLLKDFEMVAKAMYSAGTGRQADVLRANVEVARMDAEIKTMEAMRKATAAHLNAVVDRPADTPIPTPTLGALPLTVAPIDTLRAWAEASRPLLERSRIAVERAGSSRALARREIWPDFTVGLQYGQRRMADGTKSMGGVMVGFSLPIFAGKRQLKARDEAAALERSAQANLEGVWARLDAQIGAIQAGLDRSRTLIRLYREEILPQARATVESSFASYRVGTVDFMTLVDAQMAVNRYEGELFALLAAYGTGITQLEMTLGRPIPATSDALMEES